MDSRDERGGIVLSWLTRLVVLFAVLGVLGYDALAIGVAQVSVRDHADAAARAASAQWQVVPTLQSAYDAAARSAAERNPGNVVDTASFRIDPAGSARVHVQRHVDTYLLRHVAPLRSWTSVSAWGTGRHVGEAEERRLARPRP